MAGIRTVLNAAAWKLTLVHAGKTTLAILAVTAGAWGVTAFLVGRSETVFLAVVALATAACLVGMVSARKTPLDAARLIERRAGWHERLSTALELETTDSDNVFHDRLQAEVETLLAESRPSDFIPWDLERSAVVAAALLLVSVTVTVLVPDGVLGMLRTSESSARSKQAAGILEAATRRLVSPSLDVPNVNALRLELVGLLNRVRRGRDVAESQRDAQRVLEAAEPGSPNQVSAGARKIAAELEGTGPLRPLATAVNGLDEPGIRGEAERVSETLPGMSPPERQAAADALSAAAAVGELPGVSDALRNAARALRAADAKTFEQAMREFAADLVREIKRSAAEQQAVEDVRRTLSRVQSVLSGKGDPGEKPVRGSAEFFVRGTALPDNATGSGNLLVRGKPEDIRTIWENSKAADVIVPDLNDLIGDKAVLERQSIDAAYREYVRKYFAVEDDNR